MLCGLEFVVSLADCTYPVLHDLSVVVWGSIAGCGSANILIVGFGEYTLRLVISLIFHFCCLQLVIPIHYRSYTVKIGPPLELPLLRRRGRITGGGLVYLLLGCFPS